MYMLCTGGQLSESRPVGRRIWLVSRLTQARHCLAAADQRPRCTCDGKIDPQLYFGRSGMHTCVLACTSRGKHEQPTHACNVQDSGGCSGHCAPTAHPHRRQNSAAAAMHMYMQQHVHVQYVHVCACSVCSMSSMCMCMCMCTCMCMCMCT